MTELQQATIEAIVNVFETGRVSGDYSAVVVLKGDSGHLSYGRSQATLGSGNLHRLLDDYCKEPSAKFSAELRPMLSRFQQRDTLLDTDTQIRDLLKRAAREDPTMRAIQDRFFTANYFAPAAREAEAFGVVLPLGQAVVYDSHIHGGWNRLRDRIGPVGSLGVPEWTKRYVELRRTWLLSLKPPLPNTVYRMDSFAALMDRNNWDLALPLTVHGVTITEDALKREPATDRNGRMLRLRTPYLRGDDVKAVQAALSRNGLATTEDGIYGPFTDALVRMWQASKNIDEIGVGSKTRASLGI